MCTNGFFYKVLAVKGEWDMRKYKLGKFYSFTTLMSLIPLIIMLCVSFIYIDHQETKHQQQLIENAQADILDSLETLLNNAKQDTIASTATMDYLIFCNSSQNTKTIDSAASSLMDKFQTALNAYPEVSGIFLYNSTSQQTFSHYALTSLAVYQADIFSLLYETVADNQTAEWKILFFGDRPYIFLKLSRRYGSVLIMLDPTANSRFTAYNHTFYEKALFYFLGSTALSGLDRPLRMDQIQDLSLYLCCQSTQSTSIDSIQFLFWWIVIFLAVMSGIQIILFQQKVIQPFKQISESLKIISNGNLSYRVHTSDTLYDIEHISDSINDMLQKIQDYKEEGFNSRMDAVQAKMQFLQLQIKPHFYLNCLKSVNALLNLKEYENAQTLVLALSNYITRTFSDTHSFISLRSELETVQSYVTLRNITFSYQIQLHFQLDGRCAGAKCLPMSVLTFVENSIKHSQRPETTEVFIKAEVLAASTDSPMLFITIEDTGGGFPDRFLEEQKRIDPSQMLYRRTQIGISNIRYRLWLTYEREASLSLENRSDHAIVKLMIPYEPMEDNKIP